jgi:hypothetical protein
MPTFCRSQTDTSAPPGFAYKFNSLNAENETVKNELADAFTTIFKAETRMNPIDILRNLMPIFRFVVTAHSSSSIILILTATQANGHGQGD